MITPLTTQSPVRAQSGPAQSSAEAVAAANAAIAKEFLDYAQMSAGEKIRYAYLQAHNLSEEDLKAMTREEREALEAAIREEIKKSVEREAERKSGVIMDLRA